MRLAKTIIIFLMAFICFNKADAFDGSWYFTTPGGNSFTSMSREIEVRSNSNEDISYPLPDSFYFYKGYIVGVGFDRDSAERRVPPDANYFVMEESSGKMSYFSSRNDWTGFRKTHNLNPIWTRWYTDGFEIMWCDAILGFSPFVYIPIILVVVLVLFGYIVFRLLLRKKIIITQKTWLRVIYAAISVTLFIYIDYLLSTHLQSF